MATNGNNGNNGNGNKKRDLTAKKIAEALLASNGLLTLAAKKAGVTFRTVKKYMEEYPSVAHAFSESKESMLDYAEGKLFQKIRDGDNTCILFYLKTQGKSRGYIERQEHTGAEGGAIEVKIDYRRKIENALNRLAAGEAEGEDNTEP